MEGRLVEKDVLTPRNGLQVLVDRYWITRNGNGVFYEHNNALSPQCNTDQRVILHMMKNPFYEGCEVTFIPISYITRRD